MDSLPESNRVPDVAIAHDYLTQRGGAERVVLAMHRAFPEATIYTTLYDPDGTYPEFRQANIVVSPINRVGPFRRDHRLALPALPFAASRLNVPGDVVLVSSTGWAHGFKMNGSVLVYCHSPARWLYLSEQYLGGPFWRSLRGWALFALKPYLLWWDRRAAGRADRYISNSTVVHKRIQKAYGIESDILHPPHSVDVSGEHQEVPDLLEFIGRGGHFLLVSRLLPYKNVGQAIDAFRGLGQRLVIVGAGPLGHRLVATLPPNVRMVSNLTDAQMRWLYASCSAVIAPSHEDFGITPLEAGAWGKPTIALRAGGYLDTIVEGVTGAFIQEPTAMAIREALMRFRAQDWESDKIRSHVSNFSESKFRERLQSEVMHLLCNTACNAGDKVTERANDLKSNARNSSSGLFGRHK